MRARYGSLLTAGRGRAEDRRRAFARAGRAWSGPAVGRAAAVIAAAGVLVAPMGAGGGVPAGAGGGSGDTVCGTIRFDRATLPGRPLGPDDGFASTGELADLLGLRGWPRAVPYDAATWTVLTAMGDALLIATTPAGQTRYLPASRQPDGTWEPGPPCAPRPVR